LKRWKKISLVVFCLLLLSQAPFAYRRYRLGRLHAAIQQLAAQRTASPNPDGLLEFKGVVHVHSSLGGHSNGNFSAIIAAAQANQLNFVVMTEHPAKEFDTAAMTLKGEHGGVLFLNGNETSSANGDRLLLLPGDSAAAGDGRSPTQEVLSRRTSGLALVAYPEEFKSWDATGYQGLEVYNVYTNARQINPLVMFFDGLWSYRSYPELLFANFYRRPADNLKRWDDLIKQKGQRLVATAGNDAHANIGVSLNDSSGKTLLGVQLDPYERSFRLVRLHVLAKDVASLNGLSVASFDERILLEAIAAGHCFIGFDLFGDTTGFRFTARDANENLQMGDEIKLEDQVNLHVNVPLAARIVLLKDGVPIHESNATSFMEYKTMERGSYRVEVYQPQLPGPVGLQPWIISNPIYVK
jgi:hypothetical protein